MSEASAAAAAAFTHAAANNGKLGLGLKPTSPQSFERAPITPSRPLKTESQPVGKQPVGKQPVGNSRRNVLVKTRLAPSAEALGKPRVLRKRPPPPELAEHIPTKPEVLKKSSPAPTAKPAAVLTAKPAAVLKTSKPLGRSNHTRFVYPFQRSVSADRIGWASVARNFRGATGSLARQTFGLFRKALSSFRTVKSAQRSAFSPNLSEGSASQLSLTRTGTTETSSMFPMTPWDSRTSLWTPEVREPSQLLTPHEEPLPPEQGPRTLDEQQSLDTRLEVKAEKKPEGTLPLPPKGEPLPPLTQLKQVLRELANAAMTPDA